MESFQFGDTPEMADELLSLVLEGKKVATCHALDKEKIPEVGARSIILDGKGKERVIIETTEVAIRKFKEVDGDFAKAEGEGSLTLEYWRKAHKEFFMKEKTYSEDMLVVCERFKILEILN